MTLLCPKCFGDVGLKRRIIEIRPQHPRAMCTFHPRYKGIPIEAVAEIIDPVFQQSYRPGECTQWADEGDPLEHVAGEFTDSQSDEITQALADALIEGDDYWPPDGGEPFFSEEYSYVQHEYAGYHHSYLWDAFCKSIVHEQRFFNRKARDLLVEIFDGVQLQRNRSKKHPVYEISPRSKQAKIHRARITSSERARDKIRKNPSAELGPPPERKRKAGRMNPAGIATFYGGFNLETCVAELRPVVGSVIIAAEFKLIRPVYVLDTTRFNAPMKESSPFYKKYFEQLQQWQFMQTFMREIARPILPTDEHIDYIPTQAVAEYFLHNESLKLKGKSIKVEGIIYESAQYPDGKNIVLLGEAAMVRTHADKNPDKRKSDNAIQFEDFNDFDYSKSTNPGLEMIADSDKGLQVTGAEYTSGNFYDYGDSPF